MANPIVDATQVIIDDRDANILYSNGDWGWGGTQSEYNGTTQGAGAAGATAIYTFNGEPNLASLNRYSLNNLSRVLHCGVRKHT
jgi:hypothetical protein